ncbi:tetratricopeptide repeat protein [Synechococcales cyanobacterium C]|uniref:Tetratricopeptide repeat protein n=1 Tax=Petrachloros mirabilis ULC683 TaxID=2781853 RepID=A0A8K1ZWF1_9CYAN|nr:tetratricopeptide repeat-containing serine protease family protein [Petrachloros mirabilis]NCJ05368.1 tetratricopeptide repeat protein [Petrachloros mirabilis ULC683]
MQVSKVCLALAGWVVAVVLPLPVRAAENSVAVGQLAKEVTVLIEGMGNGSGVIIQRQGQTYTLLTAKHVISSPDVYEIVTARGHRYDLDLQAIQSFSQVDLAIVTFQSTAEYPVAPLGNSDQAVEGMPVYVAGFPGQASTIRRSVYNFTQGHLTAQASEPQADGYALIYTNHTLPGMSGGPVFNEAGQVIGIHGQADGRYQQQDPGNPQVFIKSGFNLGIPINTFLALAPDSIASAAHSLSPSAEPTPPESAVSQRPEAAPASPRLVSTRPPAVTNLFLQAVDHYQRGDLQAAMQAVQSAIRQTPDFAQAYAIRGNIRLIRQDYPGALTDFSQALSLDQTLVSAYMGQGLAQSRLGNREAAIAAYTEVIQLNPNYGLAHYNRGVALLNSGNAEAALTDLQAATDIALQENNPADYERAQEATQIAARQCRQSIRTLCDR